MKTRDDAGRAGILTERFDTAVSYVLQAHDKQTRKSTEIPYAAHLLGVASIVLENGGTETEAIAALLHDVVEDQGGSERRDDVEQHFGPDVARIVQECSAEDKSDGAGWRARKQRYIDGIAIVSTSALLVSLADKVYNARAILDDYRAIGDRVWDRFGAPDPKPDSIRWYYGELLAAYRAREPQAPPRLIAELRRTLDQLTVLTGRPCCPSCGAGDVLIIGYGLPRAEDFATAAERGVLIGGCVINEDSPDFECCGCGATWSREDRERNAW